MESASEQNPQQLRPKKISAGTFKRKYLLQMVLYYTALCDILAMFIYKATMYNYKAVHVTVIAHPFIHLQTHYCSLWQLTISCMWTNDTENALIFKTTMHSCFMRYVGYNCILMVPKFKDVTVAILHITKNPIYNLILMTSQ